MLFPECSSAVVCRGLVAEPKYLAVLSSSLFGLLFDGDVFREQRPIGHGPKTLERQVT